MGFIKNIFDGDGQTEVIKETENDFYEVDTKELESADEKGNGSKMILLEPRAFSESQQIADHLKKRNTVVINLRRVTSDQAKRIIDFVSGSIYALKGHIEKIGSGIFLCTPNNVNIQGKITSDKESKEVYNNDDIDIETW
jgi:cell division inhibitor SepF